MSSDEDAVSDANAAFYGAFEARDLDAMADVWDRTDRATITHPGWPTLHGWAKVAGAWDAIFRHTPYIQFFLMNERVHVVGDVGWVTLEENILQTTRAGGAVVQEELDAARVAAVNVFVRTEGRWRMVLHQGAPIAAGETDTETGEE